MATREYQLIKEQLKNIKTVSELKSYILEHDDILYNINTSLLNSWVNVLNYKIYRCRGVLGVIKADETRARTMTRTREEIDELKCVIELLRNDFVKINNAFSDLFDKVATIINILGKHNLATAADFLKVQTTGLNAGA
jgi:hypothetical protein